MFVPLIIYVYRLYLLVPWYPGGEELEVSTEYLGSLVVVTNCVGGILVVVWDLQDVWDTFLL